MEEVLMKIKTVHVVEFGCELTSGPIPEQDAQELEKRFREKGFSCYSQEVNSRFSLRLWPEECATPGKFRLVVVKEAKKFQLGADQDSLEQAIEIYMAFGENCPFYVYNDRGVLQTRQFTS